MKEWLKTFPDGREVLDKSTTRGFREYIFRTVAMVIRQGNLCCLCGRYLSPENATFDHEDGRGMGGAKRDDRIVLPDGRWINGAAHWLCNSNKGSRFVDYNRNREAAGC